MENLYNIGGQIWVQKNGENFMGPGRISLLENLIKFGKLQEACIASNMSLEVAKKNIEAVNNIAKEPLVIKNETEDYKVTLYGEKIIETYKELKTKHNQMLEDLNREFIEKIDS